MTLKGSWHSFRPYQSTSCPLLIILKSAFFRGLRVYELKFRSKKDNEIIFFSSESWDVAFFKSATQEASRRLPETLFWYEILKFFKIFKKMQNFQTKIELREASWRPPGFQIWKKQHLSFHWKKKIITLSCLENILGFVTYLPSKWVSKLIFWSIRYKT